MTSVYLPLHRKTYSRWLVAIGLTVTLGFCVICAFVFDTMGRRDYEQARQSAINVTSTINSDIERIFELYDLSLQAAADGLKLPNIWQIDPQTRQLLLFDRAATANHLGAIIVLDREGRVLLNSRNEKPGHDDRSSSDYFTVHKLDNNVGLYVGPPSVNTKGEYVLNISRRITDADGSFNGVVTGSLKLSLFHNLFRKVNVRENDSLSLSLRNGTIVMRSPFDVALIGRDVSKSPTFHQMLQSSTGSFESVPQIDKINRLYVYRHVRNTPLIMSYGQSVDTIFAGWWSDAMKVAAIVLLLCASNVGLIIFLARALKKRSIAEYSLNLTSTLDSLTGMFNRRKFDDVLDQEWRRALRTHTPIAALMIDADNFKAFNDKFGHQAGDSALKSLAECIRNAAQRDIDLCARYGGEEFVVVLPGCDAEQAKTVAERVRSNVLELRDGQHETARTPTVSIGISAVVPVPGLQGSDLIEAADAALYQAKLKGRNCVVLASPPAAQPDAMSMVA